MGSQRHVPPGNTKVTDEDIVTVLEASDSAFLSTAEVAEALPIGKRATSMRLNRLAEADVVATKQTGVGNVWWLPTDETAPDSPIDVTGRLTASVNGDRERIETGVHASLLLVLTGALMIVTAGVDAVLPVSILVLDEVILWLTVAAGLLLIGGALFFGITLVVAGRYVFARADFGQRVGRFRS